MSNSETELSLSDAKKDQLNQDGEEGNLGLCPSHPQRSMISYPCTKIALEDLRSRLKKLLQTAEQNTWE